MRPRGWFLALGAVALAVLVALGRIAPASRPRLEEPSKDHLLRDYVERVVDGDTVMLSHLGRSRIIGIDTAEIGQPGAAEATEFTKRACLAKWVRVEVCPVTPRDKYGRPRIVLYYEDDMGTERMLAEELILNNHSLPRSLQPCHISDDFWCRVGERAGGRRNQEALNGLQ